MKGRRGSGRAHAETPRRKMVGPWWGTQLKTTHGEAAWPSFSSPLPDEQRRLLKNGRSPLQASSQPETLDASQIQEYKEVFALFVSCAVHSSPGQRRHAASPNRQLVELTCRVQDKDGDGE